MRLIRLKDHTFLRTRGPTLETLPVKILVFTNNNNNNNDKWWQWVYVLSNAIPHIGKGRSQWNFLCDLKDIDIRESAGAALKSIFLYRCYKFSKPGLYTSVIIAAFSERSGLLIEDRSYAHAKPTAMRRRVLAKGGSGGGGALVGIFYRIRPTIIFVGVCTNQRLSALEAACSKLHDIAWPDDNLLAPSTSYSTWFLI